MENKMPSFLTTKFISTWVLYFLLRSGCLKMFRQFLIVGLSRGFAKNLCKMLAIILQIHRHIRRFNHVIADKRWQRHCPDKFVGFMEVVVHTVHAVKEIPFTGEGFNRRIPSE